MPTPLRRLRRLLAAIVREVPADAAGSLGTDDPRVRGMARSITQLYGVLAVVVTVWVFYLAAALPERSLALHYDVTWVGFDLFLVSSMAATAWYASRLDPRVQLAANATATLLIVDAWMDVTTSPTPSAFRVAVAMAILVELPLAALSIRVAHNVHRAVADRARRLHLQHETERDRDAASPDEL